METSSEVPQLLNVKIKNKKKELESLPTSTSAFDIKLTTYTYFIGNIFGSISIFQGVP